MKFLMIIMWKRFICSINNFVGNSNKNNDNWFINIYGNYEN